MSLPSEAHRCTQQTEQRDIGENSEPFELKTNGILVIISANLQISLIWWKEQRRQI